MANYSSQHQGIKGNDINVPHFYENEEVNAVKYGDILQGYNGGMPTLHSVAQTYDQNQKLKEIFHNKLK